MKKFLILLLLSGCAASPLIVSVDPDSLKSPTLQWTAPPKQQLSTVQFDFPRLATMSTIANTTTCHNATKVDPHGIYPTNELSELPSSCIVPAIDNGSNLYIGLTETNYRNLVNNYNILIMREKRWEALLDRINLIQRKPVK